MAAKLDAGGLAMVGEIECPRIVTVARKHDQIGVGIKRGTQQP